MTPSIARDEAAKIIRDTLEFPATYEHLQCSKDWAGLYGMTGLDLNAAFHHALNSGDIRLAFACNSTPYYVDTDTYQYCAPSGHDAPLDAEEYRALNRASLAGEADNLFSVAGGRLAYAATWSGVLSSTGEEFATSADARRFAREKDHEGAELLSRACFAELAIKMGRTSTGTPAGLRAAAKAAAAEADRADRIADELAEDEAETARYGA